MAARRLNWLLAHVSASLRLGGRVSSSRWMQPVMNLETAVEEGFRARQWPSHPGKEALWDEF